MSILVNSETRVLTQGITGATGQFHTRTCKEYGTRMVAGVTPGKGGTSFEEIPVFDSVEEAVRETAANASVIYVPPAFCRGRHPGIRGRGRAPGHLHHGRACRSRT